MNWAVHQDWMDRAIALAKEAGSAGEVPVGAMVVKGGELIAAAANRKERDHDPTAHAELLALRYASKVLKTWHLGGCALYVTLEPCPMCAGAILHARIGRVFYGVDDPKTGALRSAINLSRSPAAFHRVEVYGGIREQRCLQLIQSWFQLQR
ncbi:MAG: nucleoside deaminase [Oscillatoriales cyanobacterium SM2_2_1]|nr:nucleoside deaminase [Oscillatoriales cyanobacterium SM2_2_1]